MEPDPRAPAYIQTVRDVGYRFDPCGAVVRSGGRNDRVAPQESDRLNSIWNPCSSSAAFQISETAAAASSDAMT